MIRRSEKDECIDLVASAEILGEVARRQSAHRMSDEIDFLCAGYREQAVAFRLKLLSNRHVGDVAVIGPRHEWGVGPSVRFEAVDHRRPYRARGFESVDENDRIMKDADRCRRADLLRRRRDGSRPEFYRGHETIIADGDDIVGAGSPYDWCARNNVSVFV